jgi:arylsulfatase A-like enzyme
VAFVESAPLYYNYSLTVDGTSFPYFGKRPSDYSTDVLAQRAVAFIHNTHGPLFLEFAPFAPHGYPVPAPRDRRTLPDFVPSRPKNFDEADVSDKPSWVRRLPRLTPERVEAIGTNEKRADQTLGAVDDAVGKILDALTDTGRLHHTMVVFASDNGFAFGEHRWTNKLSPYEESIRVPIVIRDDSVTGPRRDGHLVLNIDLAPTFADVAGVTPPSPVDGKSLRPLLNRSGWSRGDFLVEHEWSGAFHPDIPSYCSVRNRDFDYTLYQDHGHPPTWEEELYSLRRDPFELHNLVEKPGYAKVVQVMRTRLQELCDPPPPGFTLPF